MRYYFYLLLIAINCNLYSQNSLLFDGDDFVRIENPKFNDLLDRDFAIEIALRQTTTSTVKQFAYRYYNAAQNQGIGLFVRPNGRLGILFNGNNHIIPGYILDDSCHQVSVVRRNNRLLAYVDGLLLLNTNVSDQPVVMPPNRDFFIGGRANGQRNFIGELDELRIYSQTIDQTLINSNLLAPLSNYGILDLEAYYHFNSTHSQLIFDASGNDNDGFFGNTNQIETTDPVQTTASCIVQIIMPLTCDLPATDPCNLICNPHLDDLDQCPSAPFEGSRVLTNLIGAANECSGGADSVTGWYPIYGTVDYAASASNSPVLNNIPELPGGDGRIHMAGLLDPIFQSFFKEGIITEVNVTPSKTYLLSYHSAVGFSSASSAISSLQVGLTDYTDLPDYPNVPLFGDLASQDVLHTDTAIINTTRWEQNIVCFTPVNARQLLHFTAFRNGSNNSSVFLDGIDLIEDTFPDIPTDFTIACGDTITIGEPVCTVSNMVFDWYDGMTQLTNGATIPPTITAAGTAAGIVNFATDIMNNPIPSQIIVMPNVVTTFELRRRINFNPGISGPAQLPANCIRQIDITVNVNMCGAPYISQVYEGLGLNDQFIEVKNATTNLPIGANTYYLALYKDGAPTSGTPDAVQDIAIDGPIAPEEARTFKNDMAGTPVIPQGIISNLGVTFNFDASNDIIILTTSQGTNAYTDRIDLLGDTTNWGQDQSWVRSSCAVFPRVDLYDPCDWVSFTLSEVDNPMVLTNPIFGRHRSETLVFDTISPTGWSDASTMGSNPDRSRIERIASDYNMTSGLLPSFEACSLTVATGLNVTIATGQYISVENALDINPGANVTIQNGASFVQVKDGLTNTITGNSNVIGDTATVEINSNGIQNFFDFTFWSSPVFGGTMAAIFPTGTFNQDFVNYFDAEVFLDTDDDSFADDSDPTVTTADDTFKNQSSSFAHIIMEQARGYGSWPPTGFPVDYTLSFNGHLGNGRIPFEIWANNIDNQGSIDSNLTGNPYPSAIDLDLLLTDPENVGIIEGTASFFDHNIAPADLPGPATLDFSANDFAHYNLTGSTQTAINGTKKTRYAASGQSFFVYADATTTQQGLIGSMVYKNYMRVKNNNTDFRFQDQISERKKSERELKVQATTVDRIWLNITTDTGAFNQVLIGFHANASTGFDRLYDGGTRNPIGSKISFYSIIPATNNTQSIFDRRYAIQGLPSFTNTEVVPLGVGTRLTDNTTVYTISIDSREGALATSGVWLKDNLSGACQVVDLTTGPYSFTVTSVGLPTVFDNRFELHFTDPGACFTDSTPIEQDTLMVIGNDHGIKIYTERRSRIYSVELIDIYHVNNYENFINLTKLNTTEVTIPLTKNRKLVHVKVTLTDGTILTKKIVW